MTDISDTILAKSDQLNAVDLPPQSITVTIVKVSKHREEQPVSVHLEGYEGRPFKPCLSMRRVLAQVWGTDSSVWVGRSMVLYCDNSVKWAGKEVGGIRISHMSDIPAPVKVPIAISKHVRAMYEVLVLKVKDALKEPPTLATDPKIIKQINAQENVADLMDVWNELDKNQQEAHKAIFSKRRASVAS